MPPASQNVRLTKSSNSAYVVDGARIDASVDTDCVATTATSQPPLMPSSSGGFVSFTVSAVKTAYTSTSQRMSVAIQNASATDSSFATMTSCDPRTLVPATVVKKPTQ